jgi:hypothetical protein
MAGGHGARRSSQQHGGELRFAKELEEDEAEEKGELTNAKNEIEGARFDGFARRSPAAIFAVLQGVRTRREGARGKEWEGGRSVLRSSAHINPRRGGERRSWGSDFGSAV